VSEPKVILIGDKARLVVGSVDVTVEARKVSAGGKERWEFCGSFGSLLLAARSLVEGRNVGLLLPEQIADVAELADAILIASATVRAALERARSAA
jgi:hypothetical protein